MNEITQTSIGAAPDAVRQLCAKWNEKARAASLTHRTGVVAVTRASGRVNYHLWLISPTGIRLTLSLGAVDKATVVAAINSLLARAGTSVPFSI